MQRLGGSVFAHNAVRFDYCLAESVKSLCAICDEVVALDAQSEDETLDVLRQLEKEHGNLKVVEGAPWNCAPNYNRLVILADMAKSHLKTPWHFMLQADEVIHERSVGHIREMISNPYGWDSAMVRRLNLFGDLDHYLGVDIPQKDKPCSDAVIRLAKIKYGAYGDAESLQVEPVSFTQEYTDKIIIFHYGLVRKDANLIEKIIDMQSWFSGPGSQPDHRVVAMQESKVFDWRVMKERELLRPLPYSHPVFSQQWVEQRRLTKPIPV